MTREKNESVPNLHAFRTDYERLKRELAGLGFVVQGTLLRRMMTCGKPNCRCHASPPDLHGPYFQWSRKVGGKTATDNLTETEAALYEEWIANSRRLDEIVGKMRALSMRALRTATASERASRLRNRSSKKGSRTSPRG